MLIPMSFNFQIYNTACVDDINVALDLYHVRELRGSDAFYQYRSAMKRLLPLCAITSCHIYVKCTIFDLRQFIDMPRHIKQLVMTNTTTVHRECFNKNQNEKSTYYPDEFLEIWTIKVAKKFILNYHEDRVKDVMEQLNGLASVSNSVDNIINRSRKDKERTSRARLRHTDSRFVMVSSLFRHFLMPIIETEVC
jgi:hypothetical protein